MITKIPLEFLSIDSEGTHLMIYCYINGLKANFLIDTGASRTVFDLNRLTEYYQPNTEYKKNNKFFSGIGAANIDTYLTSIDILNLGEVSLKNLAVVLFDLKSINHSYAMFDLPRIDGVLGGDILKTTNAVIDYYNRIIVLEQPSASSQNT